MTSRWSRHDAPDRAVARILEGAEKAFSELGVSRAGMSEIAECAGCSRGTLYRYFPTRHDLHVAYVERTAEEIAERVRSRADATPDPRERLVAAILGSVREVRRRPGTLAWFRAGVSESAARMARASEMVDAISVAFVGSLLPAEGRSATSRTRARWLVRVIVSLLSDPGASDAEERTIVERFVVPGLLGDG